MKFISKFVFIIAFTQASLASQILNFDIKISPWIRSCKESSSNDILQCQLPKASLPTQSLKATLHFPSTAGEIFHVSLPFVYENELKGQIRFYAVYPKTELKQAQYIQIQIETNLPSRSLCLQSVRLKTPMEFPPLTCTGLLKDSLNPMQFKQFGFNVFVSPLKE